MYTFWRKRWYDPDYFPKLITDNDGSVLKCDSCPCTKYALTFSRNTKYPYVGSDSHYREFGYNEQMLQSDNEDYGFITVVLWRVDGTVANGKTMGYDDPDTKITLKKGIIIDVNKDHYYNGDPAQGLYFNERVREYLLTDPVSNEDDFRDMFWVKYPKLDTLPTDENGHKIYPKIFANGDINKYTPEALECMKVWLTEWLRENIPTYFWGVQIRAVSPVIDFYADFLETDVSKRKIYSKLCFRKNDNVGINDRYKEWTQDGQMGYARRPWEYSTFDTDYSIPEGPNCIDGFSSTFIYDGPSRFLHTDYAPYMRVDINPFVKSTGRWNNTYSKYYPVDTNKYPIEIKPDQYDDYYHINFKNHDDLYNCWIDAWPDINKKIKWLYTDDGLNKWGAEWPGMNWIKKQSELFKKSVADYPFEQLNGSIFQKGGINIPSPKIENPQGYPRWDVDLNASLYNGRDYQGNFVMNKFDMKGLLHQIAPYYNSDEEIFPFNSLKLYFDRNSDTLPNAIGIKFRRIAYLARQKLKYNRPEGDPKCVKYIDDKVYMLFGKTYNLICTADREMCDYKYEIHRNSDGSITYLTQIPDGNDYKSLEGNYEIFDAEYIFPEDDLTGYREEYIYDQMMTDGGLAPTKKNPTEEIM